VRVVVWVCVKVEVKSRIGEREMSEGGYLVESTPYSCWYEYQAVKAF
jgi:hypothetical protein